MIVFQDIVAAVGVVFDAVTQAIMAMSFGFAMVPTAIAYAIGIVGCLAYGSVLPISMQAETIALAGTMGKDIRERLSMVMYAGFSMAILGGFGILQKITDFAAAPSVVVPLPLGRTEVGTAVPVMTALPETLSFPPRISTPVLPLTLPPVRDHSP